MVEIKNLSITFGKHTALKNINLKINKGEFVFITGISGSGKTTLIRILTRDLIPNKGTVCINHTDILKLKKSKIHTLRRNMGIVFQDFKLLTDLTVYENVAIALKVIGYPGKDLSNQVKKTLKLVGLGSKQNQFPLQLAGGELQRVCLARAVVTNPPLLIADEPTGNLDPTTSWQIMELIKKINKSGTTVIMATHNTDIVNSMTERVISLEKGEIIQDQKDGSYEIK